MEKKKEEENEIGFNRELLVGEKEEEGKKEKKRLKSAKGQFYVPKANGDLTDMNFKKIN